VSGPDLVIVNPAAAGGRLGREWQDRARTASALGLDAPTVMTEAPAHATELAADAARDGADLIVVAGGDGTVCEVAEGLYRAGRGRLAVLPLGTGNDFARTVGVPTRFDAAVRVALDGRERCIDLIRVGERIAINAIGLGLTADINVRAMRVKFVRGIAVYAATALVSLVRYTPPEVRLRCGEVDATGPMTILAVHNGPTTGGGFRLTPAADPADGKLDACLVGRVSVLGRLARLVAALRGTLGRMPGSLEVAAPWLDLEFSEPLAIHIDGNATTLAPPSVRFEIVPDALWVKVAGPST